MGGEEQLEAVLRRVDLVFVTRHPFQRIVHQLRIDEATHAVVSGDKLNKRRIVAFLDATGFVVAAFVAVADELVRWEAGAKRLRLEQPLFHQLWLGMQLTFDKVP